MTNPGADIVDLIWFLPVAARQRYISWTDCVYNFLPQAGITPEKLNGTAVIMRYTLRLLAA